MLSLASSALVTDLNEDEGSVFELLPTTSKPSPELVQKDELDALVASLDLGKVKSEELASFMRRKHILAHGVRVTAFRRRDSDFKQCFVVNNEKDFVYCYDIDALMLTMGINYMAHEWRLFIDSSKNSLKAVLLHRTNKQPPMPIAYGTDTKENYKKMEFILKSVNYSQHGWRICCDLKVVNMLAGMGEGYVKHMCFLCDWDSRYPKKDKKTKIRDKAAQYKKQDWKPRPDIPVIGKLNQTIVWLNRVISC